MRHGQGHVTQKFLKSIDRDMHSHELLVVEVHISVIVYFRLSAQ